MNINYVEMEVGFFIRAVRVVYGQVKRCEDCLWLNGLLVVRKYADENNARLA